MKNIPIIAKFLTVMGIFGIFSLGVAVFCTMQMRSIDTQYTSLLDGKATASLDVARASRNLQTARASIGELMISSTQAENDTATASLDTATQTFTDYMDQAIAADPEHTADFQTAKSDALDVLNRACAAAVTQGKASTTPAQIMASQQEFLNNCAPRFPALTESLTALTRTIVTESKTQSGIVSQLTSSTILLTYIGIITGLIAVMVGGFFAIRAWVITPVKGLQTVMGRLAGGDLNATVDGVERRDEIGGMAGAVQVFKDAGLEKVRLEAEAKALQARADAEREQAESERAEAAKRLAFVVSSLADALEKLSKGDLVLRLSTPFSAEYEKLRTDFNGAMDTLQQTMKAIATNTHGVRSGAGEITQASDDLSRRTEQQAASLEETAAALDQITATVRRTADNANNARTEVAAAKSDAERSGQVVRETVTAMTGIESSSAKSATSSA